jgi:predicted DNA-binding protein
MSHAKRTKSFSARFSEEIVDMLDASSERLGQSKARVAERLIEEGLRIEEFPGIIFRSACPRVGTPSYRGAR